MLAAFLVSLLLLPTAVFAEIHVPEGDNVAPIVISAQAANRWQQGTYEVWLLRGNCRLLQGRDAAFGQEAVFWIDHAPPGSHQRSTVIAYLEGNIDVRLVRNGKPVEVRDQKWFGRFYTVCDVQVSAGVVDGEPRPLPSIYQHGMDARNPEFSDSLRQTRLEQTQYAAPAGDLPPVVGATPPGTVAVPPGTQRVRVFPRGDVPLHGQWQQDPQTHRAIAVIDQGVTMRIDGLTPPRGNAPGIGGGPLMIDVSTDRMVIWTVTQQQQPDLNSSMSLGENQPMEVYMEGNVVFRQGDRTIYADRMYYDVRHHLGTVLGADVLTSAPSFDGKVRLHADILNQIDEDHFIAQGAYVTTSLLGLPRYRLQMAEATFEDRQTPRVDWLGNPAPDPKQPDRQAIDHQELVTARNNLLYIEDIPVFYWPIFATDLNDPSFYLRRIQYRDDGVFGEQLFTDWAGYQLFGIKDRPKGTDWTLTFNYMSLRGPSAGTEFQYLRDEFLGIPGKTEGIVRLWGILDHGTDNLGYGRPSVEPEPDTDVRYRILEQHHEDLGGGFTFMAEVGKISDRNFLLEYFKQEWDEMKDPTTDVQLQFRHGDMSMDLFAGVRLDNFVTETQWLPRFDHYMLGESLLPGNWLTWFEHTSVGYGQFKVASLPALAPTGAPVGANDAAGDQPVSHLPWEPQNFSGARLVTRNELDLPLELGPVKVVPYVLGELGYWGQDINGQELTRAYYQAGIRATLPMWAVDSCAESELWNIHGLAHKVEFQAEYLHAQSNQSMTQFPLYDPLDDEQIEDFRRRYNVNLYNLFPVVPPPLTQPMTTAPLTKYDERAYALRTDMEGNVTAPSMEIADDLDELRLGIHQRWQTKRGPADNPHIIDWIEFDTDVTFFPDATRDNFGTDAGLLDYNFVWHVGDRLTLLSNGLFDFFGDGQKVVSMGMFLTRPPRGALYAGFTVLDGPIHSDVLSMSYSYWMSPKWITTCGMSIDLKEPQNFGPSFQIIRVGESMLIGLNFNYVPALRTGGVSLTIQPRFVPKTGNLNQQPGIQVGQAGAFGVE